MLDFMGTDLTVVNAARVSMAKESQWEWADDPTLGGVQMPVLSKKDAGLLNYLARHKHWTPSTHCVATFRIKAPIFVRAQLWKHVLGLGIAAELPMNEVSRRYVDDEPEFWFPAVYRERAPNVKQGSLETAVAEFGLVDTVAQHTCRTALKSYREMLERGLAPELARAFLPQNVMTEWWWTGNLAAWARVYGLRTDPHAQVEAGDVARAIGDALAGPFPNAWAALV